MTRTRSRKPKLTVQVGKEISSPLADKFAKLLMGKQQVVPDKTLEDHSTEGYELYNTMLRKDTQLSMCFRLRALTVMAQGWQVQPGPEDPEDQAGLAAFAADVFGDIRNFDLSRKRFFRAIAFGFQPTEIIYKLRDDGKIGIERFANRNPERFRFDADNELLLTGAGGFGGEKMPADKFMLNTWGSDETPYGEGLLREIYPLWFFKANGIKELVRFIEKFGSPYLWANYPRGISKEEQDNLLNALKQMIGNSVGIGPQGTDFVVNDFNRTGVIDVFRFLIEEYVDRQYAKAILGQTLSTESESGTHALAKFQSKGQQHIVEEDSRWQQEQLNEVIRIVVDINFGAQPRGKYPHFRIAYEEEKDLAAYFTAIGLAVNNLGLPVGEDWLREQSGIPAPAEDDLPLTGKKMPAVRFPAMDAGDSELDEKQEEASGL